MQYGAHLEEIDVRSLVALLINPSAAVMTGGETVRFRRADLGRRWRGQGGRYVPRYERRLALGKRGPVLFGREERITMAVRWMIAGAAALVLAVSTLPAGLISSHAHTSAVTASTGGTVTSAACDAEAKPANFEFTLKDHTGNDLDFGVLQGKVVVLNFWATWCGPCKIEVPWFVEFAEQYKDDGLVVIGVSIDDTADKIQAFVDDYDVNYSMLVGLGQEDFLEAYGPIWGVPMTFFIDREGTVCRTHAGIATRDEFEKDISDLL